MQKRFSWIGIATAAALVAGCAHHHRPDDTAMNQPAVNPAAANELPGSEGPLTTASNDNAASESTTADTDVGGMGATTGSESGAGSTEGAATGSAGADATGSADAGQHKKAHKKHKKHKSEKTSMVDEETNENYAAADESDSTAPQSAAGAVAAGSGASGSSASSDRDVTLQPMATQKLLRAVALNTLHHVNEKEIALAKIADKRADSDAIKQAANQIRNDHERLEKRVEEVADRQDVDLESFQPATFEKAEMDGLKDFKGHDFDVAYLELMREEHRMTAQGLQKLRGRVSDPDILALIDQTLPVVRHHEAAAGDLGK